MNLREAAIRAFGVRRSECAAGTPRTHDLRRSDTSVLADGAGGLWSPNHLEELTRLCADELRGLAVDLRAAIGEAIERSNPSPSDENRAAAKRYFARVIRDEEERLAKLIAKPKAFQVAFEGASPYEPDPELQKRVDSPLALAARAEVESAALWVDSEWGRLTEARSAAFWARIRRWWVVIVGIATAAIKLLLLLS